MGYVRVHVYMPAHMCVFMFMCSTLRHNTEVNSTDKEVVLVHIVLS